MLHCFACQVVAGGTRTRNKINRGPIVDPSIGQDWIRDCFRLVVCDSKNFKQELKINQLNCFWHGIRKQRAPALVCLLERFDGRNKQLQHSL